MQTEQSVRSGKSRVAFVLYYLLMALAIGTPVALHFYDKEYLAKVTLIFVFAPVIGIGVFRFAFAGNPLSIKRSKAILFTFGSWLKLCLIAAWVSLAGLAIYEAPSIKTNKQKEATANHRALLAEYPLSVPELTNRKTIINDVSGDLPGVCAQNMTLRGKQDSRGLHLICAMNENVTLPNKRILDEERGILMTCGRGTIMNAVSVDDSKITVGRSVCYFSDIQRSLEPRLKVL